MAMKVTSSWIIYSCFIFGSSILCDKKLEIRQAVSSSSENIEDKFYCSNGLRIEWSSACDGHKDCSDGSDEMKELCARYEYGTNISMDCGTVSKEIKNEHSLEATPWIVDIYKHEKQSNTFYETFVNEWKDTNYYHLGLGTIISPNVVVSAADIFWFNGIRYKQNAIDSNSRYLFKIDIPQTDNDNTHYYIDVKMIYMFDEVSLIDVFSQPNSQDLAVIVLTKEISFSNGVTPVCIDWYSKYNVRNGTYGKIAGFNEQNQLNHFVLQRFFPHIDNSSCLRNNDEDGFNFCIRLQLEEREVNRFYFQSLSFLHSNSYFLTGITSCWPYIQNNKNSKIDLGFIDIKNYIPWIRGILNKHSTANSCVLPTVEGVVHSYEGSHSILSPRTLIDSNTTVIENCEVGYHKTHPNGFRVCQRYGIWKTYSEKLCLKMCPPLLSDSLNINCSYSGKYANCSNLSIPDTIATPKCKPTYALPNGQKETPIELHCQSNGVWNNKLYTCEPDCGRPFIETRILINNGEKANIGTAPWNVAIYKKKSNYDLICGGSIISRNLVVSAAHCFSKTATENITIIVKDGLYKIAVGKYDRNFSNIDNEITKIMNVERIHLNEAYFGVSGYYAGDIAVVVLQNSVSFSNGITPICMDWNGNYKVSNGDQGKIVGWGKTENGIPSPVLLGTHLPYIDMRSCRSISRFEFKPYVTHDKFCAGSTLVSGHGVDLGDSGAGLCFLHSNLYYLTGVVSSKDPDANNSIALFTSVHHHISWIRGILNKHSTANSCVLPTVEGVVHSYEGSHSILFPGTLIDSNTTVIENCAVGYHKAHSNGFRVCQTYGIWETDSRKLCLKMCPPLLPDISLDIKCIYNGKYANCSNLSIPDTIATPKCKPTYDLPNGLKETPLVLHCLSNGLWDNQLYKCEPAITCVLPTVEGVVYTYEDSNESLSHGTLINHGVTVNENCTFGYHNVYPESFRVCQKNGKWKPALNKLCLKMCPPLLSDSVDIKCSYNGNYANCSNLSIPDTIATLKCKPTYALSNGHKEIPLELHCLSNGLWDDKLYICEPECGRTFVHNQVLIANGKKANIGTAPWNVAIYEKKSYYDLICGGSIISRNLVVSAAHCFSKTATENITIIVKDDLYKIAVGKYDRNFSNIDNEITKVMNVDRIHLKETYFGLSGNYAEDIAVVMLQNSVSFSNGITPICMDWNGNYKVSNGDQGKIVGWGKTENGIPSPDLLETHLPYIDMRSCRSISTFEYKPYVTHDKFCAGSTLVSGHGVDLGDSGAGLCFLHSNLYYLTGVMSLKDPNANNSIALFTSVHHHISWIRQLYTDYKNI